MAEVDKLAVSTWSLLRLAVVGLREWNVFVKEIADNLVHIAGEFLVDIKVIGYFRRNLYTSLFHFTEFVDYWHNRPVVIVLLGIGIAV